MPRRYLGVDTDGSNANVFNSSYRTRPLERPSGVANVNS